MRSRGRKRAWCQNSTQMSPHQAQGLPGKVARPLLHGSPLRHVYSDHWGNKMSALPLGSCECSLDGPPHCGRERTTSLPGGWLRWFMYQRVWKPHTVMHQLGKHCKNIRERHSRRNTQDGMGSNAKLRRGGSAGVGRGGKRHLRWVGRVMPPP